MKKISSTPDRRLNFVGQLFALGATILLLWKVFWGGGGQWMLWTATAILLIAVVLYWRACKIIRSGVTVFRPSRP